MRRQNFPFSKYTKYQIVGKRIFCYNVVNLPCITGIHRDVKRTDTATAGFGYPLHPGIEEIGYDREIFGYH